MDAPNATADIGLIGLAVMGENLVLNIESHGYTVAVFNRTTRKVDEFVNGRGEGQEVRRLPLARGAGRSAQAAAQGHDDGQGRPGGRRADRAARPAARAGRHPHRRRQHALSPTPTAARSTLEEQGPALHRHRRLRRRGRARSRAPASCPAAAPTAWPHVKPIFQAIAAKVDDGTPCCDWVGAEGAGHYVKMVHNGIEYGDMQLICEAYHLLKDAARPDDRRAARRLRRVEPGRARQLPDRDHPRHLQLQGPGDRQAAGRQDPRHGRPEGHRQVDRRSAPSTWACRSR